MGTTKDPEGFRRHTAGRGDVLGVKGGGPRRRGCGLGLGVVLAALGLGVAALTLDGTRGVRVPQAVVGPGEAALQGAEPFPPDVDAPLGVERELAHGLEGAAGEARATSGRTDSGSANPHGPVESAEARGGSCIRLLRGWSDVPLAEVETYRLGIAELQRMRRDGLTVTTVELEPVLRRHGRRELSGPDGRLCVGADGCHLLVVGEGWTRELEVAPGREGLLDVRVFALRTLAVDVFDWRGAPAPGIGVELWRVDALGEPRTRLESLRTSPVKGTVRYEDVDPVLYVRMQDAKPASDGMFRCAMDMELRSRRLLEEDQRPVIEPTRLRITVDEDLAPGTWAEIDLAQDPLPPVQLRLPPLGEVHVVVADEEGRPVTWAGEVQLRVEEAGAASSQVLVEGRASFANLRFGQSLRVEVKRSDGAKGEELQLAALTPDEPEREVVLRDIAPQPRLVMRPIHPDGRALPRTWCDVRIAGREAARSPERMPTGDSIRFEGSFSRLDGTLSLDGTTELLRRSRAAESQAGATHVASYRHVFLTDAGGYLDLPLPPAFLDATELTLVLSLRDGVTMASAPRRLERGEAWGDVDLGNVPLLRPLAEPDPVR